MCVCVTGRSYCCQTYRSSTWNKTTEANRERVKSVVICTKTLKKIVQLQCYSSLMWKLCVPIDTGFNSLQTACALYEGQLFKQNENDS